MESPTRCRPFAAVNSFGLHPNEAEAWVEADRLSEGRKTTVVVWRVVPKTGAAFLVLAPNSGAAAAEASRAMGLKVESLPRPGLTPRTQEEEDAIRRVLETMRRKS